MSIGDFASSSSSFSAIQGEIDAPRSNFVSQVSSSSAGLSQEASSYQAAKIEAAALKSFIQKDQEIPEGKQEADAVDSSDGSEAEMPEEFEFDEEECSEEDSDEDGVTTEVLQLFEDIESAIYQFEEKKCYDQAAMLREKIERLKTSMKSPAFCYSPECLNFYDQDELSGKPYRAFFINKLVKAIMDYEREDRMNACAIFLSRIPMSTQEVSCFLGSLHAIESEQNSGGFDVDYARLGQSYFRIERYENLSKERQAEMDQFLMDAARRVKSREMHFLRNLGPLTKEELKQLGAK